MKPFTRYAFVTRALLVGFCLHTCLSAQTRPRVRDHRDSKTDKERRIQLAPPVEGPVVQWRLLANDPALAGATGNRTDTRYRLMSTVMQLTIDPRHGGRLQLRQFTTTGMRANVAYHRSTSANVVELNEPFGLYLPEQRAYVVYRGRNTREGYISERRMVEPPGIVAAPDELGVFEWNPAGKAPRALPAAISQWVFRITGDKRTRSIASQRRRVGDQWFLVSEELALFNTSANAYLVYDANRQLMGWKNR